jgi:hypothetical protein
MKYMRMMIVTAFIAMVLVGCGTGKDSALVGEWVRESDFSPISVITFDGKICTIKDSVFGNTTEYQYTVDAKEGAFNMYPMGADIKTAKPSKQKYSVNGYTLQLSSSNGPYTFRKNKK